MMRKLIIVLILCIISLTSISTLPVNAQKPNGSEYKIYQFPNDKIPRLDGDLSDWSEVPESYIIDTSHLFDSEEGNGFNIPRNDLDVRVIVAWNDSTNRVYFMVKQYDDFHNFNRPNLAEIQGDDIFEVVIDADHSEGLCFTDATKWKEGHEKLQSVTAQNYHTFIPPRQGILIWIWGIPRWLENKPYSDGYCKYDGQHGSSGWLNLEWYITPYDYASHLGPKFSAVHDLEEGDLMGLSFCFIDWDASDEQYDGFYNLAHDTKFIFDAGFLQDFRLMPVEGFSPETPKANFDFELDRNPPDKERSRIVKFINKSTGNIEEYYWDFGDGTFSKEKEPTHDYLAMTHPNVVLTVKGPRGEHKKLKVVRTY